MVHNESWCGYYKKALGWTEEQLTAKRDEAAAAWKGYNGTDGIIYTHGHQIVHKLGAYKAGTQGAIDMTESQRLLTLFGIDLLDTPTKTKDAVNAIVPAKASGGDGRAYVQSLYRSIQVRSLCYLRC